MQVWLLGDCARTLVRTPSEITKSVGECYITVAKHREILKAEGTVNISDLANGSDFTGSIRLRLTS